MDSCTVGLLTYSEPFVIIAMCIWSRTECRSYFKHCSCCLVLFFFFLFTFEKQTKWTLKNRDHIIQVSFAYGLLYSYVWLKWYEQSLEQSHEMVWTEPKNHGQYFTFFRFVLNMWFMVSCSLSNQMWWIDFLLSSSLLAMYMCWNFRFRNAPVII